MSKKRLMRLKLKMKQKKPDFKRQEWFKCKRIGTSWRRTKGLHSSMRKQLTHRSAIVKIGYRSPVEVRGLHPSGLEDIIIHNVKELEALNPEIQGARVASTVGKRKKIDIIKRAEELGIKIFNISKKKQDELLNPKAEEVAENPETETEETETEEN
ncbi:50S ribosomal protein L32e [Methanococcus aeolicus]|jgi:large subunit ribosomal protein L32e|uniref:Large ribosomal subunit protein eL32 n=1 Tax=Methanococcus aeolicus (strain ATCC BAA-1280 / DSM 17508 / OCM 812 / Nankai-3) TaxID=419665 RepID=A6UWV5_META3|nr:50S ribosomal protein L32e [Methanococcus aeolicus]ABR56977.1 Ribosomal protein L32e [Methanococcus aeolicus Nankai-3]UXM84974.1 50S ribosomal protein L32e [Methanococcus aeolicus]